MSEPVLKSIDAEPDVAVLDAEALADLQAGRVVSHAEVARWLRSWGQADELPCPQPTDH